MRRIACFTMAALCGAAAFGEGLLDCVDPDVLRALLSQGEQAPIIAATVPQEISALRMPAGFTWIGSAERMTGRLDALTTASQVTAAWRSSLAPDAARAAATAALATSGWEVRPSPGVAVFGSSSLLIPQTACREGKPVNVIANAMEGVTYVLLSIPRDANSMSVCNQPVRPTMMSSTGLDRHLPRLELPVDPGTGASAVMRSSGTSFGGTSLNARAAFAVRDSAATVARHFARQMSEQGWASDASWSGASTAGSSWSKRPESGTLVQGTLAVTAVDERQFEVVLRISTLQ